MVVQSANKLLAFMLAALLCLCLCPFQLCFADEEGEEPEPEPEPEPELVVVPSVSGMTREQAEETLRNAGFSVSFSSQDNGDMDKDTTSVIYTEPSGGSEVEPGSTITVYIYIGTKEEKKDDEGDDEGDDSGDEGDEGDDSGDEGDEGDDEGDEGDDEGEEGDDPVDPTPEDADDSGNSKPEKDKKPRPNKPEKTRKPDKSQRRHKPARTHTEVRAHKINNATWGYYSGVRHVRTKPIAGNLPYSVTHQSENTQSSAPANMTAYEISKAAAEDPAQQESSRMVLVIVTALCVAALVLGFLYRMTMHSLLMKGDESAARKRRAMLKGRR